jgi:PAS domain S-box-containing protein
MSLHLVSDTASEPEALDILKALPFAAYVTDRDGRITAFNEAAAAMWGRRPNLGEDLWCGSYRLFWPDGRAMAHDECPMAEALQTGKASHGVEAVLERPDGSRVPFTPYPTVFKDTRGAVTGGLNILIDLTDRQKADRTDAHFAAIVESSDDAIISKGLDGVIRSWNKGAERIFGFSPEQAVGQHVSLLIPDDRLDEEPGIIERIRKGERIDHYETIRRRRDGTLINVSLTVSPVKNPAGQVVGASKVARDVTDKVRAEEARELLCMKSSTG